MICGGFFLYHFYIIHLQRIFRASQPMRRSIARWTGDEHGTVVSYSAGCRCLFAHPYFLRIANSTHTRMTYSSILTAKVTNLFNRSSWYISSFILNTSVFCLRIERCYDQFISLLDDSLQMQQHMEVILCRAARVVKPMDSSLSTTTPRPGV